jgi:hypothetical protein
LCDASLTAPPWLQFLPPTASDWATWLTTAPWFFGVSVVSVVVGSVVPVSPVGAASHVGGWSCAGSGAWVSSVVQSDAGASASSVSAAGSVSSFSPACCWSPVSVLVEVVPAASHESWATWLT